MAAIGAHRETDGFLPVDAVARAMSEQPAVSSVKPRASPWPIPLVLGLVAAELGIVFGGPFLPVAVAGLLLFGGSVAGILRESAYVTSLWRTALGAAAIYTVAGAVVVTQTSALLRGQALVGAGVVAVVAAVASYLVETGRL